MELMPLIILLIINLYGIFLMGFDKSKAKKGQYRISERTLWIVAICGGAVGTTIGMNVFRHKTKHKAFQIGMPFLVGLQLVVLFLLFN
ncbi:DUF1294 domain-containing protein [Pseudoneobacillus rhizosphaerae]|uniref:DUF1294 domain-containing protein n=1 Tax=Pseudoneobacillus rhizosphaerae TaxID=2880968 RepID=A0A9C7LA80_9BACI|nr:DUF1294 domain-containing protein [Pseudoneobacillus rhizosphaerae]CAG9608851.1 hypothetical protein NEOCIP111885_02569 [Pseudoneobacillus rhizosphaerae]